MKFQFHHIHVFCKNLEKMIPFFTDVLGATLKVRQKFGTANGAMLDLHGTPINIKVLEKSVTPSEALPLCAGWDHVALEVEDVEAVYTELTGLGYSFTIKPFEAGGMKMAFFQGPEGLLFELLQPIK